MGIKTLGISVVIGGVLASSLKNSFKLANSSLAKMGENIKKLEKTRLKLKEFKELSKDSAKNADALNALGKSLRSAGIDVRNIDEDTRAFRRSLINLKRASKVEIKLNNIKEQFEKQKASIIGLGATLYGYTKTVSEANNILKAQGEIRSLNISKKGIDEITKSSFDFSLKFGQINADEMIKASYDIKSGISSLSDEGVNKMTQFATLTAVATKSSVEEMTKLYALGYGIFRKDFKLFPGSTA